MYTAGLGCFCSAALQAHVALGLLCTQRSACVSGGLEISAEEGTGGQRGLDVEGGLSCDWSKLL